MADAQSIEVRCCVECGGAFPHPRQRGPKPLSCPGCRRGPKQKVSWLLNCITCSASFEVTNRAGRPSERCAPCRRDRRNGKHRRKNGPRKPISLKGCVCAHCGASFASVKADARFCCAFCRYRHHNPQARLREVQSAERRAASLIYRDHSCEGCGEVFKPKAGNRLRFCSRDCFFATMAKRKQQKSESRPGPCSPVYFPTCGECSGLFAARGKTAKFCVPCCRARAAHSARERSRERVQAKREALPPQPARSCGECGQIFQPEHRRSSGVFCSATCNRRNTRRRHKHAGRARLKLAWVEQVDPIKVFERDRWRCKECGVTTPRKLRGTYSKRAPELDHRIPLSKGGEHSYRNTQCLCRKCNGEKSDATRGQLQLFG